MDKCWQVLAHAALRGHLCWAVLSWRLRWAVLVSAAAACAAQHLWCLALGSNGKTTLLYKALYKQGNRKECQGTSGTGRLAAAVPHKRVAEEA